KAREMAKKGAPGDRRFVDAVDYARVNQGNDFKKAIPALEKLTAEYPGERLGFLILGQLYNGNAQGEKALAAFRAARAIGPRSARVEAFLAADDLLKGRYDQARATLLEVEKTLP